MRQNFNYDILCGPPESKGCCNSRREETLFCWNAYENIFPGALIHEACSNCCNKTVGSPNPPLPGVPQTMKCFDAGRPSFICKACCRSPRSTNPECLEHYATLGDKITEVCVSLFRSDCLDFYCKDFSHLVLLLRSFTALLLPGTQTCGCRSFLSVTQREL